MQKEQTKIQLTFNQYPSIEISTRDKFVNKIKEAGYDRKDILWVASEKIHGANFSIHYYGQQKIARYGRRTDFLSEKIPVPCENPAQYFTQTFLNAKSLVNKFHNNLDDVFQKVKKTYPQTQIIQIYGEYFGGQLPVNHPNYVKGLKSVQKGVYYTSNHEFMAFDIKITTPTSIFWADVIDIPNLLDGKLMHVPIYATGSFYQVLQIDTKIDSTIPEILGLVKVEKNIIQGMILRPNKNLSLENGNGQRVILKKKNLQFMEKASAPKQKKQKIINIETLPYIEKLGQYLNFNRIQSVISKFPDVKDRNKIKNQLCKDIYLDAQKDDFVWPQNQQLTKSIKDEFSKLSITEINSYFVKH